MVVLLASFDLTANRAGTTTFSISDALFGDFFGGNDLIVDTSAIQTVQVSKPVQASTPATLGIFVIAALGLLGNRRKA